MYLAIIAFVMVEVVLGQHHSPCYMTVGHNMTVMVEALGGENPYPCTTQYQSAFRNGTIVIYDENNVEFMRGNYTIEHSDDNQECYARVDWPDIKQHECSTWSPSMDGHGMIGCFVWNEPCARRCGPETLNTGWFAGLILNELPEENEEKRKN